MNSKAAWHAPCDYRDRTRQSMKNNTKLIALLAGVAAPTLAFWIINRSAFPTEILFGSYTIAGLLWVTAASYSPGKSTAPSRRAARPWIRRSFSNRRALRSALNA